MEIEYSTKAIEDVKYWKKKRQSEIQEKITLLIREIEN